MLIPDFGSHANNMYAAWLELPAKIAMAPKSKRKSAGGSDSAQKALKLGNQKGVDPAKLEMPHVVQLTTWPPGYYSY